MPSSLMYLALLGILLSSCHHQHQHLTAAQTPPSFIPSCNQNLGIRWSHDLSVSKPGRVLLASDTAREPSLSANTNVLAEGNEYLLIMLDPDVQFPSQPRTTILHWMQASFRYEAAASLLVPMASQHETARYAGPHPPAGQQHRYILMLFVQPREYTMPEEFKSFVPPDIPHRIQFNVSRFMDAAGLGAPVAASFFMVQGPKLE